LSGAWQIVKFLVPCVKVLVKPFAQPAAINIILEEHRLSETNVGDGQNVQLVMGGDTIAANPAILAMEKEAFQHVLLDVPDNIFKRTFRKR